ncbi:basal cell adhesion molecule-like isoform X2 [Cataglyphis hispanica]|uniref:basal cell adhesion molecule-like isoform X2 n=1 Tax=Cataglyphis hispanica TaxID=1086592 RepID=UPI00217FD8A6|nr:basal cell adhesion molecule-like isoform X2 [Cataglyphis hispanica]XP_050465039.1 basal cell adhesion molecule-like isoform X2 [Cataglyphis hispanica]
MDQKVRERRRAMDFVLLLLVMLLRQEVAALKILKINVPAYILRGKTALLECRYDPGADILYAITWYKDHEVFYKYLLRSKEGHTYLVNGVKVDKEQSNDQIVVLQNASLHASGKYKCEINAEAPNFSSVSADADMEVIAISQESPSITGEEKVYASGDVLALNCTSGKSNPAAQLKWFVNGEQVKSGSEIVSEQHGLYSTISSLELELEPGHLASDKINVRCEATVRSSHDIDNPFVDTRKTEVFVRGLATLTTPSLCLALAATVLQRFLLPV